MSELNRNFILDLLRKTPMGPVVDWSLEEDWRTWLMHFSIVALVTAATHGVQALTGGDWATWASVVLVLIYLFFEIIDARSQRKKWIDHSMDWVTAWGGFGTVMMLFIGDYIPALFFVLIIAGLGVVAWAANEP